MNALEFYLYLKQHGALSRLACLLTLLKFSDGYEDFERRWAKANRR